MMEKEINYDYIPIGTQAFILSKLYYGVLSKRLNNLEIERYYSILYFLNENDNCCQQMICNNLAIDKTAMVKVIDYLIKLDLVQRKPNPKDRREHFIILTEKGKKYNKKIVQSFKKIDELMFSSISQQHKKTFLNVLETLCSNLKTMPSEELLFDYKKTTKKVKS